MKTDTVYDNASIEWYDKVPEYWKVRRLKIKNEINH
jgi:hypothetical protein